MARISSAMIPASSLADISRAQQQLVEAARQSSSQTRATDLKGYGRESQTLVSAERLVARNQSFQANARELTTRMTIQDVAIGRAAEVVSQLKDSLFQNVSLDSGVGIRVSLNEAFEVLRDAMNTNIGGRYLFGGVMNENAPVTAASLNDLALNPLEDSIATGEEPQFMRIEDGRTIQAGLVADDVISEAFASLKRLAELDAGPDGPFDGTLTQTQRTALESELRSLSTAFDTILTSQSENGRLMKDVDNATTRLTAQYNALDEAIGGIVNVDLAEVAVRLNQAQFAYQSSASIFNTLRGMSLLDILR